MGYNRGITTVKSTQEEVSAVQKHPVPDSLAPECWANALATRALGKGSICYAREMTSTNLVLRQMAREGAPHGSLCLCETQSAGKGRLGRSWHSPQGQGLWLSVLLRPQLAPAQSPLITLCAALAMQRAVSRTCGVQPAIKWPNDLVLAGKKLCGVLLEMSATPERLDWVIVGTGLNTGSGAYPPELAHQATSLQDHGVMIPRREILAAYLPELEDVISRLAQEGFSGLMQEYMDKSCTIGRRVKVSGSVTLEGVAVGLDESGALKVQTDDGQEHIILSGDVSVRGVMGYV